MTDKARKTAAPERPALRDLPPPGDVRGGVDAQGNPIKNANGDPVFGDA